ncbi:hypothetical protein Lalb_Chr17g0342541 [Lupinus albus]|uniref:Uncharacterized protein n=1 Tax=Lupinus albus TaxID=3870 RepID=A0A6A4PA30_LUPAL|nr:hypothetical protein Lalb_Chr17g0342541 [Lupinus albus]
MASDSNFIHWIENYTQSNQLYEKNSNACQFHIVDEKLEFKNNDMKGMYPCTKYAAWVGFTFLSYILGGRFIKLHFETVITQFCLGNSFDSATDCATAYIDQGYLFFIFIFLFYITFSNFSFFYFTFFILFFSSLFTNVSFFWFFIMIVRC